MIQYSEDTQRLINNLAEEYDNEIKNGLLATLSKQEDQNDAFNLLKNHGYDIPYDEFKSFYQNIENVIEDYVKILDSMTVEGDVSELSETDLEGVTGGYNSYYYLLNRSRMLRGGQSANIEEESIPVLPEQIPEQVPVRSTGAITFVTPNDND
jgi:hypothetical protein